MQQNSHTYKKYALTVCLLKVLSTVPENILQRFKWAENIAAQTSITLFFLFHNFIEVNDIARERLQEKKKDKRLHRCN